LPDDLYRITIVGAGDEPLMNTNGDIFHKGEDVGITFDLDLGALITAIVPQPTYRDAAGELQQHRDKVVVYFNSDTLDEASAENLDFYRLTLTGQTADTADDVELTPQSVVYDAVANTVELTFSDDLANLGTGAFRLRIGNEWREIVTEAKDAAEIIAENELDVNLVGDTFLAALELGMLGSATEAASLIVSSAIEPQAYDLDWPGAISEIGHRDLPLSRHYSSHYTEWYFANDDQYGIATIAYNFKDHYGDDPAGNPLHNLISEEQKNRAREVFELYGHYLGVQFVETDFSGFTIATGDMRALDPTVDTGPGGIIFKADNDVVIMDAAEDWNESLYGGDETNWFATAMQGIGYLLGLGYADDMDPVTIMGNNNNTMYNGDGQYYSVSNELVYPGNQDIVHGRHIFRPDGNDVDIYKFEIDEAGKFSAETIAERMDGSSLLDSNLKLYDDADNLIAGNDDYYSEDSYVEVYLQPGTYYVAVSSTGNNQYDPRVAGSGIGGTTQGPYDLRVSFTPDVGEHLSDTTGTRFDGDADGVPGGVHNFWFNVQPLAGTIFVDKIADGGAQDGSLANPYTEIDTALAMADADDIVRIVGNYDRAYMDHVEYETGPLSNGLAAGDLNGDGWKDIVTTGRDEEEETNHVSILFGVGDGTFWDPVTYEVGEEPMSVELGDITGDGLLDIIVTNSGENTISLLGNMGDGTFQTLPKRFVGNGPTDLALGDLNGDGDLDIVVANTADDTVSILLSDGNGGFLDQDVHIVGTAPSAVAVGDVDNNQRVDVIVANSEDDTINVLLNEENIHTEETEFEIQAAIDVGVNPSALAAGDLTGDGTVDVVVVNAGGDNISVLSGIAVLSGLGDGTFATPLDYYVVDGDPTDVKLAALDNNSTLDVVVSVDTDTANDKVLVLFTLPDGSLETPVEYGVGDAPGNLVLADLDNDGVVDIATTNTGGDSVSVLLDHRDAAYEIGFDLLGRPLEDGWRMEVPQGVTVMVDAGAVFKLRQANIDVGSSTQGVDRSEGALQVLGTPDLSVYFTSFHNKLMAQDNAGFDVPAAGGDWGGLVLRNKLDYEFNKTAAPGDERTILEEEGIFLNYVNHADITFGGGQVVVNSSSDIYNPLHMVEARPTLTYNTLTGNADAAMSADPNSFADTKFQGDTFTADYDRVGPEIHGNYIVDNSINGIFVRVNTEAGKAMDELQVSARWDDLDIAHVLLENLIISGTPGGPKADAGLVARQDARLAIDPGVLVKLDATRIEAEMGAQLIAEGNDSYPIVFTSLDDDRYGMGGTFDTSNNAGDVTPEPGDWGGIYFAPVSSGSIDNALFAFAGGVTPIEGGFAGFN
ncbi:MAG: DVUA0089 family protein, partial [Planctomycetota bacterium]|nr:DVUA0089 family protein [Planctomycetota bacterium]